MRSTTAQGARIGAAEVLLCKVVRLDPATGNLFWLPRTVEMFEATSSRPKSVSTHFNNVYAGRLALHCINNNGYRHGHILGERRLAHQVVFALSYGHWPTLVDHIDRDRLNNRPENLREVSAQQNSLNSAMQKNNTSGFRGVTWSNRYRKWVVRYCRIYLGHFSDKEEAALAYDRARLRLLSGDDPANLNFPPPQDRIVGNI